MLISICVASIRGSTIKHLIKSIINQTYLNWELIIAAQGEDILLHSEVEKYVASDNRIKKISLSRFGRSYALNEAIKISRGEVIAFTDDDCTAAPDWLETIYHCLDSRADVGIIAGDLLPAPKSKSIVSTCPTTYTIECIYKPSTLGYMGPVGFYWGGANFAIRRSALDAIGPLDEYLGPGTKFPAAEDVDFALRAEALDVTMWTTPTSIIHHTYGRRNGIISFIKHHRSYALGSGALGAKLELWNHRLYREWNQPITLRGHATSFLRSPIRKIFDTYKLYYIKYAENKYLSDYNINNSILTIKKAS